MSTFERVRPVVFALCAALAWGSAQAATVSQSMSFTSPTLTFTGNGSRELASNSFFTASFNPFNSSLGTLTGFKISWVVDTAVTITVASPNTTGFANVSGGGGYRVNNSAYTGSGYSGGGTTANATPTSGPVSIDPSVTNVTDFLVSNAGLTYDPAILTAIIGTNPVSLNWDAATRVTFGSIDTGSAVANGKVTLDYIYTAVPTSVPEPGSLALAFGGLLAAVAARRVSWRPARVRSLRS